MTIETCLSIAKDILLGLAAVVTAIVALVGLTSWRRELKGKTDFETARNLMRATYALRERLREFRTPFFGADEFPSGYKGVSATSAPDENAAAWAHAFQNRWRPLAEAIQEFDIWALEAEVLWGEGFREQTRCLRKCATDLRVDIDEDLRDKASGGRWLSANENFAKEVRENLFAMHGEKNAMTIRINEAVVGIEALVQPHFRRR